MHKRINLIKQLRVEFTKTRHSSAFKAPVSVKGTLIYQKPANFLINYKGGINVQLLSNGEVLEIQHDRAHTDVIVLSPDSNASVVSDPWLDLIRLLGIPGFDRQIKVSLLSRNELLKLHFATENQKPFENVKNMIISVTHFGEIKHITVMFSDGGIDEIHFDSWAVLLDTDPEIVELKARLQTVSLN